MTTAAGPFTEEQVAAYARDGYLEFDAGIPHAILDAAIRDCASEWERQAPNAEGSGLYRKARVQDYWRRSENVHAIALAPRVLAGLRQLYGRAPRPFQTLNFNVGTEQAVHSDTIHFNSQPAGFMCGVWVALEDADADNGPLVYYPGSHRLPEVTIHDLGLRARSLSSMLLRIDARLRKLGDPAQEIYTELYEPHIAALIEERGLKARHATIPKGRAVIWAANLLHGGSPQRDKSRSRLSQVTHYFFEGCRYYTPLLEKHLFGIRQVAWRNPGWIT